MISRATKVNYNAINRQFKLLVLETNVSKCTPQDLQKQLFMTESSIWSKLTHCINITKPSTETAICGLEKIYNLLYRRNANCVVIDAKLFSTQVDNLFNICNCSFVIMQKNQIGNKIFLWLAEYRLFKKK